MAVDAAAVQDAEATAGGRAEEVGAAEAVVGADPAVVGGDVAAATTVAEAAVAATTPMPAMRDRRRLPVCLEGRRPPSRQPRPVYPGRLGRRVDLRHLSRWDPADNRCRPSTSLCPRTPCRASP